VRDGGANPESNGKLRDIIAKAKANNMPNDVKGESRNFTIFSEKTGQKRVLLP